MSDIHFLSILLIFCTPGLWPRYVYPGAARSCPARLPSYFAQACRGPARHLCAAFQERTWRHDPAGAHPRATPAGGRRARRGAARRPRPAPRRRAGALEAREHPAAAEAQLVPAAAAGGGGAAPGGGGGAGGHCRQLRDGRAAGGEEGVDGAHQPAGEVLRAGDGRAVRAE